MPMGYWTVISKEPFRFLICMQVGNFTLSLIRENREAAIHFMPWSLREKVVEAGHVSGEKINKAETLGFVLKPADNLRTTKLVEGAEVIFECQVAEELAGLSGTFALFILDVVAVHGNKPPVKRSPIFYLSVKDFATIGERWKSRL